MADQVWTLYLKKANGFMTIRENAVCLADQVHEALVCSPYLTRSKGVRCETHDGRVTIHGEVGTYFQKQMATEVLRKVHGIGEINNQLQVNWPALS